MQHATYGTSFVTNKLMEPHLLTIINPMLNLTNMFLNQRTHLGATIFLSKPPGICGQPRIVEVGGVPYLVPTVKLEKLYDMKQFPDLAEFNFSEDKSALIFGPGAAPWTFLKRNAEVIRFHLM